MRGASDSEGLYSLNERNQKPSIKKGIEMGKSLTISTQDKMNKALDKLLEAKKLLCQASIEAVYIREQMDIELVKKHVQAGADEIKNMLYPPVTKEQNKQTMIEMLRRAN